MIVYVYQKYTENFAFQLFIILQQFTRKICYFLKKVTFFLTVSIVFSFMNKTLGLNNLKIRIAMNATISVFVICVEAIIYWLLCNLHDCTFNVFMSVRSFRSFFVNFEQITQVVLEFSLLTLSR